MAPMRFVAAAILFAISVGFRLQAGLVFAEMKDDVNRMRTREQQIPEFGPSWLVGAAIRTHRKLFPGSALPRKLYLAWWASAAFFLGALACVVRLV
jgi:hypothetical protein